MAGQMWFFLSILLLLPTPLCFSYISSCIVFSTIIIALPLTRFLLLFRLLPSYILTFLSSSSFILLLFVLIIILFLSFLLRLLLVEETMQRNSVFTWYFCTKAFCAWPPSTPCILLVSHFTAPRFYLFILNLSINEYIIVLNAALTPTEIHY